jgi:BlaI family transcriptional regulator, penicillinase repressor
MVPTPLHITDGEWTVLERLWQGGAASVRELARALYPQGCASEYGTVHKFLERLEAKGCVRRRKSEGVFVFEATVDRDEIVGRELEALMEKMGGSLQPLLTNLIRVKGLTADELRELLELVERPDVRRKPRRSGP